MMVCIEGGIEESILLSLSLVIGILSFCEMWEWRGVVDGREVFIDVSVSR